MKSQYFCKICVRLGFMSFIYAYRRFAYKNSKNPYEIEENIIYFLLVVAIYRI